jgi:hypothetical protein
MESYRPDRHDYFFDGELYAAFMETLWQLLAPDLAVLRHPRTEMRELRSLEDMIRTVQHEAQQKEEPLEEILLKRDGGDVALVVSEPWAKVGGPEPYHDAYVVAVFSRDRIAAALEQGIRSAVERSGATIYNLIHGSERPVWTWRAWFRSYLRLSK